MEAGAYLSKLVRAGFLAFLFGAGVLGLSDPSRSESSRLDLLKLSDRDGRITPLQELIPESGAILHFWATWCAPCREELPAVASFHRHLSGQGLAGRLIVISVDTRPRAQVEAFLQDLGLEDFKTYQADARLAGAVFRLGGYPATVFLDGKGAETGRHNGPLNWSDPEIRKLLLEGLR